MSSISFDSASQFPTKVSKREWHSASKETEKKTEEVVVRKLHESASYRDTFSFWKDKDAPGMQESPIRKRKAENEKVEESAQAENDEQKEIEERPVKVGKTEETKKMEEEEEMNVAESSTSFSVTPPDLPSSPAEAKQPSVSAEAFLKECGLEEASVSQEVELPSQAESDRFCSNAERCFKVLNTYRGQKRVIIGLYNKLEETKSKEEKKEIKKKIKQLEEATRLTPHLVYDKVKKELAIVHKKDTMLSSKPGSSKGEKEATAFFFEQLNKFHRLGHTIYHVEEEGVDGKMETIPSSFATLLDVFSHSKHGEYAFKHCSKEQKEELKRTYVESAEMLVTTFKEAGQVLTTIDTLKTNHDTRYLSAQIKQKQAQTIKNSSFESQEDMHRELVHALDEEKQTLARESVPAEVQSAIEKKEKGIEEVWQNFLRGFFQDLGMPGLSPVISDQMAIIFGNDPGAILVFDDELNKIFDVTKSFEEAETKVKNKLSDLKKFVQDRSLEQLLDEEEFGKFQRQLREIGIGKSHVINGIKVLGKRALFFLQKEGILSKDDAKKIEDALKDTLFARYGKPVEYQKAIRILEGLSKLFK